MLKSYRWDTHLHTAETSKCAKSIAADMILACKQAGYHGIIVTDHFLNANCTMPCEWPWQRRIDGLLSGYRAAKAAGDAVGVAVLFGWEYTDQGADFLTFGLPESFLHDQQDLCDIPLEAYTERVRGAGGFLSQAHPYRTAWYLPEAVEKRWDLVDGIEVINGSHAEHERHWDDAALALARSHDLIFTAGSDAHRASEIGTAALVFDEPFVTASDLIAALRARKGSALRLRR